GPTGRGGPMGKRNVRRVVGALSCLAALATPVAVNVASTAAADALPSVAVLGSPGNTSWNDDVKAKLAATGQFGTIDIFDIAHTPPTAAQLAPYGAVLVYSDSPGYQNAVRLGDELADYADAGGGVVVATFTANIRFGGRFVSGGYLPFDIGN